MRDLRSEHACAVTSATATLPLVHVVDDDASVRSALTRMLRIAGFEARGYESAASFLAGGDRAGGVEGLHRLGGGGRGGVGRLPRQGLVK